MFGLCYDAVRSGAQLELIDKVGLANYQQSQMAEGNGFLRRARYGKLIPTKSSRPRYIPMGAARAHSNNAVA